MSALSAGNDRDFVPNAFASQYISIILIIFTCIVWAFFSDTSRFSKAKAPAAAPIAAPEAPALRTSPLASLSIGEVFDAAGEVNSDVASALVTLLQSHDVNAEIEIGSSGAALDERFAQAHALERFYAASGLPAGAIKVFVREGEGIALQLKRFTRQGGAR